MGNNSVDPITLENVNDVPRNLNLVGEMQRSHRCPVDLGVLVLGAFGERLNTPVLATTMDILGQLSLTEKQIDGLLDKCCYSIAASTADIIIRRLKDPPA